MTQPKRDWAMAHIKREREDSRCRICKSARQVEMAHIIGRTHDFNDSAGKRLGQHRQLLVLPERVIPLCREHHRAYDAHLLDLLGHLRPEEEAQAVIDARGLEAARIRLCPSAYSPQKVAA